MRYVDKVKEAGILPHVFAGLNHLVVTNQYIVSIPTIKEDDGKARLLNRTLIDIVINELNIYYCREHTPYDLKQRDRSRNLPIYRFACFFWLKHHSRLTLEYMGRLVFPCDHSSVIYGIKKWQETIDTYNHFRKVNDIIEIKLIELYGAKDKK